MKEYIRVWEGMNEGMNQEFWEGINQRMYQEFGKK